MMQVYPAIFHPTDDGTIAIYFPDLDFDTQGSNIADAIAMARDALALYLDTTDMHGQAVSSPSAIEDVAVEPGEYVTLIDADPEIYRRQRKSKAVKRTISIPAWMDERASKEGLSLSRIIQDALAQRFDSAP